MLADPIPSIVVQSAGLNCSGWMKVASHRNAGNKDSGLSVAIASIIPFSKYLKGQAFLDMARDWTLAAMRLEGLLIPATKMESH
jgi:hypothetical protein